MLDINFFINYKFLRSLVYNKMFCFHMTKNFHVRILILSKEEVSLSSLKEFSEKL